MKGMDEAQGQMVCEVGMGEEGGRRRLRLWAGAPRRAWVQTERNSWRPECVGVKKKGVGVRTVVLRLKVVCMDV